MIYLTTRGGHSQPDVLVMEKIEILTIPFFIFTVGHLFVNIRVGRDDFKFLSWIVSASSYIVSVTERNSLDSMVLVWVVLHTQHKRYPCDRNFSTE